MTITAHLIKYTPQGAVCAAESCDSRKFPKDDGPITYASVMEAAVHSFLMHADGQHEGGILDGHEHNMAYEGAASMLRWADARASRCGLPEAGRRKLERAVRRQERRT